MAGAKGGGIVMVASCGLRVASGGARDLLPVACCLLPGAPATGNRQLATLRKQAVSS